ARQPLLGLDCLAELSRLDDSPGLSDVAPPVFIGIHLRVGHEWERTLPDNQPRNPLRLQPAKVLIEARLLNRAKTSVGSGKDADQVISEVGIIGEWPGWYGCVYRKLLTLRHAAGPFETHFQYEGRIGRGPFRVDGQPTVTRCGNNKFLEIQQV